MASVKIARAALSIAGLSADYANQFTQKLNSTFGKYWNSTPNGIVDSSGNLLLAKNDFASFLTAGVYSTTPAVPDAAVAEAAPVEDKPDYYEEKNGTFQCNHCDHKPYKREYDCIKHIESKHADMLEDIE